MPIDYSEYHENWKLISKETIKSACNKCELCYVPNGKSIVRFFDNDFQHPWYYPDEIERMAYNVGEDYKLTKIVLTVHHINGNKKDNRKNNLIALCQKCHLRLDLQKHIDNRANKDIPKLEL